MGVAKAALEAVSRYMATYLGPRGVRVNLVSAGPLRTVAAAGVPIFESLADQWAAGAPLGWSTQQPETVAGPVCFLMSDLAAGITGELVHVDGGYHAVRGLDAAAEAAEGRSEILQPAAGQSRRPC